MCIAIKYEQRYFKIMMRTLYLEKYAFILLLSSIGIKFCMGFLSKVLSFLNMILYIVDCLIVFDIVLYYWFYLDEVQRIYYITYSYWLELFVFSIFIMFLFHFLSTFYPDKKMGYNYYIGFSLMFISTMITMKLLELFYIK